ncbi:MAG: phosphotransferase [Promethearchaeota archaeon]|jgi:thiamine kinase-like enzyme
MEKGEIIGKGRTAEVIYWGNNRVLKLFYQDFPRDLIEYQFKLDALIGKIFPNCPKAIEKIEEKDRIGIVYEYIQGVILTEFMGRRIKTVGKGMRRLAEIHADMHKCQINDILSQKNSFTLAINKTDLLDDDQKKEIIKYIEKLPDDNKICHGDLHPENLLVSKNKLYVIDWSNAYSGNPMGDVARTYYILKYGLAPSDEKTLKKNFIVRFFFKKIKSLVAKTYINHYIKLTGSSREEIKKWDLVIFAARLREPVSLEYDNLLKMISKSLKLILR